MVENYLLTLLLLLLMPALPVQQTPPVPVAEWWVIDKAVVDQLFTEDLGAVTRSLAATRAPNDAAELMRRLSIFVRAGHRLCAAATIDRLATAASVPHKSELSHIANFLIDREGARITLESRRSVGQPC